MESSHEAPSQFQHFVPQFLLRNFAHQYSPPNGGSSTFATLPNGKLGKKMYRGNRVVNCVDLTSETPKIIVAPVKHILGQENMYRNNTESYPEQDRVEKMLSQLESKASAIFRRITESFNKEHRGIWIPREERNLLRKFLFLMKYRGPTFYQRYSHETSSGYDANDRQKLLAYMQEKGFKRPVDVWLDNIKTIIDLEMDDELTWIPELQKRMYPDDAMWVIIHCQFMYMAICTPSNPQDEFVLTDHSYHVFEGPSNMVMDMQSGKSEETAWINFHEFAPISPKLMIVLRSFLLPEPLEDLDQRKKAWRDDMWSLIVTKPFGKDANSFLGDLPVLKPRNDYTHLDKGMLQLDTNEDGSLRPNHKFFFKFFPIGTIHVNKIHSVFLANASVYNTIVFRSKEPFLQLIEHYLVEPGQPGKFVTRLPGDSRFPFLKKLAALLKEMGSDGDPIWDEIDVPGLNMDEERQLSQKELELILPTLLQHIPDDNPTKFMQSYKNLGGSKQTVIKDMEQVALMMKLRTKIDVWSYGLDEGLRHRNREFLLNLYLEFPSRRVWFYLKQWREITMRDPDEPIPPLTAEDVQQDEMEVDGPEDIVAQARCVIDKPEMLNVLMKIAVLNDMRMRELPGRNLWLPITPDQIGLERLRKIREIAFNAHVRECGIKEIERMAKSPQVVTYSHQRFKDGVLDKRIFNEDEAIELFTRMMVKEGFKGALRGRLEADLLNDWEEVFFEVIYPTPGTKR